MGTIIRSQLYQLKRMKFAFVIYLLFVLVVGLTTITMSGSEACVHVEEFMLKNPDFMVSFGMLTIGLWVGYTCGMDFKDKVGNYEVMYGHSRLQVYAGRFIPGCFVSAISATILVFVTFLAGGLFVGFEGGEDTVNLCIRCALTIFPYLRMSAFLVCLAFMIRNPYIIMSLGYGLFMAYAATSSLELKLSRLTIGSITNLRGLVDCSGWSIYNLDPAKGIVTYGTFDTGLSVGLVLGTIVSSLVMMGIYFIIGYLFFTKSDLD